MGAGNFMTNNTRVVPTRLSVTTAVACYTARGYPQVIGIRVVNFHGSSTPVVNITYTPVGSGVAYYIQANRTLLVGDALWLPFDAFGVNDGDIISVSSSIANTTDVLVFIGEVPGRSQ